MMAGSSRTKEFKVHLPKQFTFSCLAPEPPALLSSKDNKLQVVL